MQLVVEGLNYLFFQDDKFLLADLDTPFIFHKSYHSVKTGRNRLLKFRWHQCAYNRQTNQAWRLLSSYCDVDQVSIGQTACQIKRLLLVGFQAIQLLQEGYHVVPCLLSDLDRWILQIDVISNGVLFLQHGLVAALWVFGCELSLVRHIRITFLRDVEKVNSWKHILNFLLPSSRHFFSRIDELEVLDDLESTVLSCRHPLQRASALH